MSNKQTLSEIALQQGFQIDAQLSGFESLSKVLPRSHLIRNDFVARYSDITNGEVDMLPKEVEVLDISNHSSIQYGFDNSLEGLLLSALEQGMFYPALNRLFTNIMSEHSIRRTV